MKLGLGTGSTAIYATRRIGEMLDSGELRDIVAFATSKGTLAEAVRLGIPMLPDDLPCDLDLTIDGADEVDPELNVIKGGGGALLREKIVAQVSRRVVIVVDETKPSPRLGTHWPVPVEVIPFGWRSQARYLESLGATYTVRRQSDGEPVCDRLGQHDPGLPLRPHRRCARSGGRVGRTGGHRRARPVHRADDRPDRGRCGRHSSDGAGRFRAGHAVAHTESEMSNPTNYPPAFHLLAKPTGAICNLDCAYCFFLSKEMLYPGSRFRMADEMLETYLRQMIEAHQTPQVAVAWQGGEPMLMGLDFFERSITIAQKYCKPGMTIEYTIQTNGTLIDDAWAAFFKAHNFLVGISIDGPRAMHDAYRVDKGGQPTFDRVMRGLSFLQKHGVEYNTLTTLHHANADHPAEVYRFLRDECGSHFLQFIPIIERVGEADAERAEHAAAQRPAGARRGGRSPVDLVA